VGTYLYLGWTDTDGTTVRYRPTDDEKWAAFCSKALRPEHFTVEDVRVYDHIARQYRGDEARENHELGLAWYRVWSEHPLSRLDGDIAKLAGKRGDEIRLVFGKLDMVTGQDKIAILLGLCGLDQDAAWGEGAPDCAYLG